MRITDSYISMAKYITALYSAYITVFADIKYIGIIFKSIITEVKYTCTVINESVRTVRVREAHGCMQVFRASTE